MRDHERKMALYEEKVQLFNELNDNTLTENSFEMSDKLNRELKVHHNNIINSYDKLHQKILQVSRKVFNNEKVENLWHLVSYFLAFFYFHTLILSVFILLKIYW